MTKQIITLSDNAANRIKEIMSAAEKNSLGVRVGVKSGGCAGMSYIMEYTNEINPSDEVIEDKGVKVFIDSAESIKTLTPLSSITSSDGLISLVYSMM